VSLDPNELLLSLLVGSIGFVCFVYGRRQGRFPHMLAGAVLVVYPYFVPNLIASAIIAVVILGLLWLGVRLGA
jgi:hypothetical protein